MITAASLLEEFVRRTAVGAHADAPRRYLWTDAFAVCGMLGLHARTHEPVWLERALALIDDVHRVLGRHREDDARSGWISGLSEAEGARRPTAGGLRIGKPLPERAPDERYNDRLEWERDGQYYHYLTRWMYALACAARVTGDARYHAWAAELALVANRAFIADAGMYWKMSIDLRRPLVPSMGQHDPLDGLITTESLRATAPGDLSPQLEGGASRLNAICKGRDWTTQDALGTGGLLVDCLRLARLRILGVELDVEASVLRDAARSLDYSVLALDVDAPAEHRLAFRELGLAIGIRAAERFQNEATTTRGDALRAAVERHAGLADAIIDFWSRADSRAAATWSEHLDINDVTLAVALEPHGYLTL